MNTASPTHKICSARTGLHYVLTQATISTGPEDGNHEALDLCNDMSTGHVMENYVDREIVHNKLSVSLTYYCVDSVLPYPELSLPSSGVWLMHS